jgi:hypothetical protein
MFHTRAFQTKHNKFDNKKINKNFTALLACMEGFMLTLNGTKASYLINYYFLTQSMFILTK